MPVSTPPVRAPGSRPPRQPCRWHVDYGVFSASVASRQHRHGCFHRHGSRGTKSTCTRCFGRLPAARHRGALTVGAETGTARRWRAAGHGDPRRSRDVGRRCVERARSATAVNRGPQARVPRRSRLPRRRCESAGCAVFEDVRSSQLNRRGHRQVAPEAAVLCAVKAACSLWDERSPPL